MLSHSFQHWTPDRTHTTSVKSEARRHLHILPEYSVAQPLLHNLNPLSHSRLPALRKPLNRRREDRNSTIPSHHRGRRHRHSRVLLHRLRCSAIARIPPFRSLVHLAIYRPLQKLSENFFNELLELLQRRTPNNNQLLHRGLWAIPVTLQGSRISLLGVMIICELKTPWKRLGYYTVYILMNWHAREWGS
jgi:hypothetical protein